MTIAVYWDVKHQIEQKTFIYMYDSRTMYTYARNVCENKNLDYKCSIVKFFIVCWARLSLANLDDFII